MVCLVLNPFKHASCLVHGPGGYALITCTEVPCWAPLCLFAVLFDEYEGPVSFGGVATTQCASSVGTTYSRLLRTESCPTHCLLIMRAGLLRFCGRAYGPSAWRCGLSSHA